MGLALVLGMGIIRMRYLAVLTVTDSTLQPLLLPGDRILVRKLYLSPKNDPQDYIPYKNKILAFQHPFKTSGVALLKVSATPGGQYQGILNGYPLTMQAPLAGDSLEFDFFDPLRMVWALGLALQEFPDEKPRLSTTFLLDGIPKDLKSLAANFNLNSTALDSLVNKQGSGSNLQLFIDHFRTLNPDNYLLAKRTLKAQQGELAGIKVKNHYFILTSPSPDPTWDSRHWGFLSQKYIYGLPIMVIWSTQPKGGFRWKRIFKALT